MTTRHHPLFDPKIVRRAIRDAFVKLNPRHMVRNPVMFVVLVGSVLTTLVLDPRHRGRPRGPRLHAAAHALALVHRRLRQLRRGDGGGPRQGAGRRPARHAHADPRQAPRRTRRTIFRPTLVRADRPAARRRRDLHAGRRDPERRRGDRRRRVRGRVGDHGRVRAGDPRIRRRPLGGHRRYQGAVRLPGDPHRGQPGRDVHRPDDRARRRRRAPEDAQRDRAHDPALGPHDHLPVRRRDAEAVRGLQRRRRHRSRCSSPCWSASFRRRSAACSRPSASRAWTA